MDSFVWVCPLLFIEKYINLINSDYSKMDKIDFKKNR